MVDKLTVLCTRIRDDIRDLVLEEGAREGGYERCLDLRDTKQLSVRVYYNGRYDGINKAEVIGTAKLGLLRVLKILAAIFPDLADVRIYRIDFAIDLLGIPVSFFLVNCHIARVQNFRFYRTRRALSLYLKSSSLRTLLVYDKGRQLKQKKDPMAGILRRGDCLTRVEVQLKGSVPFKQLKDIRRYREVDLLEDLKFFQHRLEPHKTTPSQLLAAAGLRWLVRRYGLQAVAKLFAPAEWAAIRKGYLEPMQTVQIPPLHELMRKRMDDWFEGRIRYPRFPRIKERE